MAEFLSSTIERELITPDESWKEYVGDFFTHANIDAMRHRVISGYATSINDVRNLEDTFTGSEQTEWVLARLPLQSLKFQYSLRKYFEESQESAFNHLREILDLAEARKLYLRQIDLIRLIRQAYLLRDVPEVLRFIQDNPNVLILLAEAIDQIPIFFGDDIKVALEVIADPESDGEKQLLASILVSDANIDIVLDQLDSFDEEWFLNQLHRATGALMFDLEFT